MITPSDKKISAKESEYNILEKEISYFKTTTIPVVIWTLGMIMKYTNAHINEIPY